MTMFSHNDKCTNYPIACSNEECNKSVPRKFLMRHLQECDFSLKTCTECNKQMIKKKIEEHLKTCFEKMV